MMVLKPGPIILYRMMIFVIRRYEMGNNALRKITSSLHSSLECVNFFE